MDVKPKALLAELTPVLGVGACVPAAAGAVLPLDSALQRRFPRRPDSRGTATESKAMPCARTLGLRG